MENVSWEISSDHHQQLACRVLSRTESSYRWWKAHKRPTSGPIQIKRDISCIPLSSILQSTQGTKPCLLKRQMAKKGSKSFKSSSPFPFSCLNAPDIPVVVCVINWFQIVPLSEFPWLFPFKHQRHIHTHKHTHMRLWLSPFSAVENLHFNCPLCAFIRLICVRICLPKREKRLIMLSTESRETLISTRKKTHVELLSIGEFIQMSTAKRHLIYSRMDLLLLLFLFEPNWHRCMRCVSKSPSKIPPGGEEVALFVEEKERKKLILGSYYDENKWFKATK